MQKNKIGPPFHPILKNVNSKWIKGLNIRSNTRKLLEENLRENLDIGPGKDFLAMLPKFQVKVNKWDFIQLKIYASKGNSQQSEENIVEGEKLFVRHTSNTRANTQTM
jgi:hypothetical protein